MEHTVWPPPQAGWSFLYNFIARVELHCAAVLPGWGVWERRERGRNARNPLISLILSVSGQTLVTSPHRPDSADISWGWELHLTTGGVADLWKRFEFRKVAAEQENLVKCCPDCGCGCKEGKQRVWRLASLLIKVASTVISLLPWQSGGLYHARVLVLSHIDFCLISRMSGGLVAICTPAQQGDRAVCSNSRTEDWRVILFVSSDHSKTFG